MPWSGGKQFAHNRRQVTPQLASSSHNYMRQADGCPPHLIPHPILNLHTILGAERSMLVAFIGQHQPWWLVACLAVLTFSLAQPSIL